MAIWGGDILDIESLIYAREVICLKKFLEDSPSSWKMILEELLSPVGGRFVLHCNFDTTKLKIYLPTYYKECLNAWAVLNAKTPNSAQEVVNEIIWNNKFLCVDKVSVYRNDIIIM